MANNKKMQTAIEIISQAEIAEEDAWAIDVATKAIEQARIPKRPFNITNEAVNGGDIASFGSCPSCGYEVSSCMRFCLNCGQKLKWR